MKYIYLYIHLIQPINTYPHNHGNCNKIRSKCIDSTFSHFCLTFEKFDSERIQVKIKTTHRNKQKKFANILHIFFVRFTWKYFMRNADLLYKCNHVNINHIAKFHTTLELFDVFFFLLFCFFSTPFSFAFDWLTV